MQNNLVTLNELIEELRYRPNTIKARVDNAYWLIRRWLKTVYRYPYRFKWWYQRARYGYSDRDTWSGDYYIAGIVAGVMERIVNKGHGVSTFYAYGDLNTPVEIMVERRDKEYLHYASIFAEYAKNGPAIDEAWVKEFGGVLDEDMQDALQWLSQHFQELWD